MLLERGATYAKVPSPYRSGFILYILSQIWLAATLLKPAYLIASLVIFALIILPVVWATFRGFISLYAVKVNLAANPRFGGTGGNDEIRQEL